MKRNIHFKPQEFIAVIIEAVTTACLTGAGVSAEQAMLIGAILGGAAKGFDSSSSNTFLPSLEKSIIAALDSSSFEIPDICRELLKTDILSSGKIIEFMCQPNSDTVLREQILRICKQDPDCDVNTFPVDDLVSSITESFETEVLNNHELASYAAYCMLRSKKPPSVVYVANQQYAKSFEEPLFLHKNTDNTCVNLKNLFVLQKYSLIKDRRRKIQTATEKSQKNLQDEIADYLQDNDTPFLFIEGDAGSGKTTLVAWMNYHYSQNDEIAEHLFGNRPLLTIRLRDLDKKYIAEKGCLSSAIRKYMNISTLDELEQMFPKAIMLLDGFDELCMIEGIGIKYETLLYDLYEKELKGFQFIITTRPKFVSAGFDISSEFISLKHFDSEQREIWLDHYTSTECCAQLIDETVYSYIINIDDDTSSCICDTPMTLYMLAAKKGVSAFLENSWALYHHIFFDELSETEYNKMFPNPDRKYSHDISILRDVLYQVSEEIAFQMYQKMNQSFFLSNHELSIIIERLSEKIHILKQANMQEITERCYALCCYWKANSDRGAVEFLHNNIRDFFLAEKIYRELNETIQNLINDNSNSETCCKKITRKLCSLFRYGILETKVCEFIFLRAKFKAKNPEIDFAQYEYNNKIIPAIIGYMSKHDTYLRVLEKSTLLNPVQIITNILTCTVQLYRNAYEVHLKKYEVIKWIPNPFRNNVLEDLFKSVFCQVPVTISINYMITLGSRGDFSNMHFKGLDLRNIGFQYSQMMDVNFSDAILYGCDFSNAVLNRSDFTNADIHYASLENASLIHCNMTGVDLRGTKLPDGFISANQEDQVEHLKNLNIPGLII
jgi:hypothetical protein